jgi:hypothetical protein
MSYPKYEKVCIAYEYDFAVDGGAVSAIPLRNLGVNGLKSGLSVIKATLIVETAAASASGAATIGYTGQADAFFVDIVDSAAGAYSSDSTLGGDQLRVSATDVESELALRLSADVAPLLTVTTGALTAGKFKIVFECVQE